MKCSAIHWFSIPIHFIPCQFVCSEHCQETKRYRPVIKECTRRVMTFDQHRVGLTSFLTILGVRWMFIFPLYRINYRECGRSALDLPFKNQYRIIWAFPFKNILRSGTLFQSTRNIKIFIPIVNNISFWAHLTKHWRFSWPMHIWRVI